MLRFAALFFTPEVAQQAALLYEAEADASVEMRRWNRHLPSMSLIASTSRVAPTVTPLA